MDINKLIIVICVIIVLSSSWIQTQKETFTPMPLINPIKDFEKGITNSFDQTQVNSNLYYQEMSLDAMNEVLQRTIDRYLQSKFKDRIGEPVLSSPSPKELEKLTSEYVINTINTKLSPLDKRFKVVRSQIIKMRTIENIDLYTLHIIIHREGKRIGFSIKADVAVKWSNFQVIGITEIKAFGYISEDILLMTKAYDGETVWSDAFSINHTIIKTPQFEKAILSQQKEGLFKDRGVKINNSM